MSTLTAVQVQSTQGQQAKPYEPRALTRFGKVVEWFRYDSPTNADKNPLVKVIKAIIGILLTLVLFPAIPFIIYEVSVQRVDEKNLKAWTAFQKKEEPKAPVVPEVLTNVTYKLSAKTRGQASVQKWIEEHPPVKNTVPVFTVFDSESLDAELNAAKAAVIVPVNIVEQENAKAAAAQTLGKKEAEILKLRTSTQKTIETLEAQKLDLEKQFSQTSNVRDLISGFTVGAITRDPTRMALTTAIDETEEKIAALKEELEASNQEPTDIYDELVKTKAELAAKTNSLTQLEQNEKELKALLVATTQTLDIRTNLLADAYAQNEVIIEKKDQEIEDLKIKLTQTKPLPNPVIPAKKTTTT